MPLPGAAHGDEYSKPQPFGVLAGCVVVFEGLDYVEAVNTETSERWRAELPAMRREGSHHVRFNSAWYDTSARRLVASSGSGSVIVGANGVIRWQPGIGRFPGRGWRLWCNDDRLLFLDDPARGTVYYHPALNMWEQTKTVSVDWSRGPVPRVHLGSGIDPGVC